MNNKNISYFLIVFSFCTTLYATYYSQIKQDQFLHENYFQNHRNGVFVDIGAHDGICFSNTYFFEKELNWTGLCIEPIPEVFAKLQQNRRALCLNCCVSGQSGKAQFLRLKNNPQSEKGPEMLSGLLEKYDPRHTERITLELTQSAGNYELLEVECFTLNELLEKYNIRHIDYLSLDIEGAELEVLKSIDFDRFKIYIIDVENNYNNPEFRNFLQSKDFIFIKETSGDEFYINHQNARIKT